MATNKLLSPQDLKKIASDAEDELIREHGKRKQKEEDEQKELLHAFMSREIHPQVMDRINNNEPDWPDSLEGFAKRAYEFYLKELRPLGFKVRVQVLDFPGGMPGTIALSLVW